jgi:lysozyme
MQRNYYAIFIIILILQSCGTSKKIGKVTKAPIEEKAVVTIVEKKAPEKLWGIDISHYQRIEDWNKIEQHEPAFIFVKTTEGSTFQDPKYPEYYQEVRKHRIPVGSYHFFTYKSSGKDQAKNFLSVVKYKKGDLPLVLDAEFAKTMPPKPAIIKEIQAFINLVTEKTGCCPIVYCDYKYYLLYLKNNLPEKCKLWIVDYRSKPDCDWTFWQTTDKYTVAGIKGYVDFNMFNGTKKEFMDMLY